jgi:hypothetical protein
MELEDERTREARRRGSMIGEGEVAERTCEKHRWGPVVVERRQYEEVEEHLTGNPAAVQLVKLSKQELLAVRGCQDCSAVSVTTIRP